MPLNPIRNFGCEISVYMPGDRVMVINSKLDHLHKLKSNGGNSSITNYHIKMMKNDAYKYQIYSHLDVHITENWF